MTAYSSSVRVGPPLSGRFAQGDTFTDVNGDVHQCYKSGYPGYWSPLPAGISVSEANKVDDSSNATDFGAAPSVTGLSASISRIGPIATITFTLTAVSITVTDGAGSGSHGALKIFDFAESALAFLGSRQNYTAFAEGAALTGAAGDAVFEIGVGTTNISAAADGTLGDGVNENVGQAVAVTLSGGTGTGTAVNGPVSTAVDGTGTAKDLYLNWSGTAATIDASSTISVTGTIQVVVMLLGDD